MKNNIIKGSIILFAAALITKIIGAFYRIVLSNILGAEGIGVYQLVFPIYSLFLVFVTSGITIVVSKKVAEARAGGNFVDAEKSFRMGFYISVFLGIFFSLLFFAFAKYLALFQGNNMAYFPYLVIAITMIFSCSVCSFRGYFQGMENMYPTAISQIIEQVFKVVLGLIFSLYAIKFGLVWGVVAALLGTLVGEIITFIFLIIVFIKRKNKVKYIYKLTKKDYKSFTLPSFYASLGAMMMPLISSVESLLVVNLLKQNDFSLSMATSLFGIQTGMVSPLINFPVILISSITVSMLPNLSFMAKKGEDSANIVANCFKFVWTFILPCAVAFFVLSGPIMTLFFPTLNNSGLLNEAILLLKISSVNILFLSIIAIATASLQAHDKFKSSAFVLLACFLIKVILTIVLVGNRNINIYGVAISNFVVYFIASVFLLVLVKKNCPFRLKIFESLLPFVFSLLMGLVVFALQNFMSGRNQIYVLALCAIAGVVVYLFLLFLFRIYSFKEIKQQIFTRH